MQIPELGHVAEEHNATAESFFTTSECELIDCSVFESRNDTRMVTVDDIESFFTSWRRNGSTGTICANEEEPPWHAEATSRDAARTKSTGVRWTRVGPLTPFSDREG